MLLDAQEHGGHPVAQLHDSIVLCHSNSESINVGLLDSIDDSLMETRNERVNSININIIIINNNIININININIINDTSCHMIRCTVGSKNRP